MAETTEQYRARINQLKTSIENEPLIKKMRDDIAEGVSKTGNRQADIEVQFKDVIEGTTDKDVISAPEIIAARKGEASLNARLTKNEQRFDVEMAQNMLNDEQLRAYVDLLQQQLTSMGNISPEPYVTYDALVSANPSHSGVYVVTEDGNWYYWNSIGNLWDVGGDFQATGIANESVTTEKVANDAITRIKLSDSYGSNGLKASGEVNINTYFKDGGTLLSAPIQGTLPADYKIVNAGFIINISGSSICLQILFYMNDKNTFWTRFVNNVTGTLSSWTMGFGTNSIEKKSIGLSKLANNFSDGGIYSSNIDSLTTQGSYLVLPPYTGVFPVGYSDGTAFVIDILVTGGSFITQTIRSLYGEVEPHVRSLRAGNPTTEITAWKSIVTTAKKKRKVLFLGDSIPDASKYPDKIKNNTGISVTNVAIGGTTFSKHALTDYDAFTGVNIIRSLISGNWTLQDAANVTVKTSKLIILKGIDLSTYTDIVFAYGTNDAYSITLPGEDDDTTEDTYSGTINLTMEMLFEHAPHLQVSLISPIFRSRHTSGDGRNSDDFPAPNGSYLREFVEVLENKQLKYHVPILDLYNNSGINKFTHATFLSDGVHLTEMGADRLANIVGSFLLSKY